MDDIAEMNRKFGKVSGIDKGTVNITTSGHADTEGVPNEEHVLQDVGEVDGNQWRVDGNQAKLEGCKTCCCYSHHQFNLHYTGRKFLEMPAVQFESVKVEIATAYMEETKMNMVKTNVRNLNDFMMSVGTDLDKIMY